MEKENVFQLRQMYVKFIKATVKLEETASKDLVHHLPYSIELMTPKATILFSNMIRIMNRTDSYLNIEVLTLVLEFKV